MLRRGELRPVRTELRKATLALCREDQNALGAKNPSEKAKEHSAFRERQVAHQRADEDEVVRIREHELAKTPTGNDAAHAELLHTEPYRLWDHVACRDACGFHPANEMSSHSTVPRGQLEARSHVGEPETARLEGLLDVAYGGLSDSGIVGEVLRMPQREHVVVDVDPTRDADDGASKRAGQPSPNS
jgi:hypothetical protein